MIIATKQLKIKNEFLVLTNQRVAFWQREKALILSDLHVGKTAHFRKNGIPIPHNILIKDLERLKQLIFHFNIEKLFIVGDLFHAESNSDLNTFERWLKQFLDLKLVLIKGNHDRISKSVSERFNLKVESPSLKMPPFHFIHDAIKNSGNEFIISGHTHPGVILEGKAKQRIKLPCFQLTQNQLILPAFSLFTGLNTRKIPVNCKSYAFTDNAIFEV